MHSIVVRPAPARWYFTLYGTETVEHIGHAAYFMGARSSRSPLKDPGPAFMYSRTGGSSCVAITPLPLLSLVRQLCSSPLKGRSSWRSGYPGPVASLRYLL